MEKHRLLNYVYLDYYGAFSLEYCFLHENITKRKKIVEFSQRLIASSQADNNSSSFTTVTGTVKATFWKHDIASQILHEQHRFNSIPGIETHSQKVTEAQKMVDRRLLGYIIPVFHTLEQDAHLAGQILEKYQLSYNRGKSAFSFKKSYNVK